MKDVVFVTGNRHKAERYAVMLGRPIEHIDIDQEEVQSLDVERIATDKAMKAYAQVGRPVLVEDVSFHFNALNGLPGPFIKFFVTQKDGLNTLCRMLDGFSDRTAYTELVLCYYDGKTVTYFKGEHHGYIADNPKGSGGFGYDAIWCIDGYDGKTRAELTSREDQETFNSIRPVEEIRRFFNE